MLDAEFTPLYLYKRAFLAAIKQRGEFGIALERERGAIKIYRTAIDISDIDKSIFYIERVVKTMLWAFGGYRLYLLGDSRIVAAIKAAYSEGGARAFDVNMMQTVYLQLFEVIECTELPCEREIPTKVGGDFSGCRIGFDAGGSDRKVTATVDGRVVFSEETVWHPKLNSDPNYHIQGINHSIGLALPYLPKVDAIGVSTAGIVVDNEIRVASLFRKVPKELYAEHIAPIYKNLGKTYNCPVKVANDGDIAALAGAQELNSGCVLGIAMGTSLAGGYIDGAGSIRGYINELAFAPVDAFGRDAVDEWSGDIGVGGMYMSQDAVIKLLKMADIPVDSTLSPAEKLKFAQTLVNGGDSRAAEVFSRMGDYFAYGILWFAEFYDIKKVLFLGRVASGKGGDILIERARAVLIAEGSEIELILPDEHSRRLGQSYTAASLVNL